MHDCNHPLTRLQLHVAVYADRRPLVGHMRCGDCGLSSAAVPVAERQPGSKTFTDESMLSAIGAFRDAAHRAKDPRVDALLRRVRA